MRNLLTIISNFIFTIIINNSNGLRFLEGAIKYIRSRYLIGQKAKYCQSLLALDSVSNIIFSYNASSWINLLFIFT